MINSEKIKMPPIYQRNNRECYLDPIRKKLIYITPEETIRQRIIAHLTQVLGVPEEMILVEEHLSHYGINSRRRADVIVHKVNDVGELIPIVIIECKAPHIGLDEKAQNQIIDYCDLLSVDYAILFNGADERCYKYDYDRNQYIIIEELPCYRDLLADKYKEAEIEEFPPRIAFDKIPEYLQKEFDSYEDDYPGSDISKYTPMNLAAPVFNLLEGLLDSRVRMPEGKYGLFTLIKDYGVRMLTYGNASGGQFYGPYRSFLVDVDGSTEFFSIGFSTYYVRSANGKEKTCISVAHDDEKEAHHALQLVVEDNLICKNDDIEFWHHGKIAIGNKGSGKVDDLRMFINDRYPQIIKGNKFYLGKLTNDRLWRLDDPEVIKLIVNLISYSIVRDEYRAFVKNN